MEKHVLSKSTFIRGVQCLKSLYLHKNRPFLRDKLTAHQLNKFDRGHEVGALAHKLFPGGENCAPHYPSAYRKAIEKTQQLIQSKFPVIYEATLQAEGVLIMADILSYHNHTWDMYEVKSSLKINQIYLFDISLQYFVLNQAGVPMGKAYILHVNEDYLYEGGDIDLEHFFKKVDVSDEVNGLQENIRSMLNSELMILEEKKSPSISIGPHCFTPYPCDFMGHCWKNEPLDSVARLHSISPAERFQWIKEGFSTWKDLTIQHFENELLHAEIMARSKGQPFVRKEWLTQKLLELKEPFWVFIIAAENAIPLISGTRPFEPVPLAWGISEGQKEVISIAHSAMERNPFELFINDAYSANISNHKTLFTAGPRSLSLLKKLFPDHEVEDLMQWLWSPFLYFPFGWDEADPWLFAAQAGLMDVPPEKTSSEKILRKIQKDIKFINTNHFKELLSTELSAMQSIFRLIHQMIN